MCLFRFLTNSSCFSVTFEWSVSEGTNGVCTVFLSHMNKSPKPPVLVHNGAALVTWLHSFSHRRHSRSVCKFMTVTDRQVKRELTNQTADDHLRPITEQRGDGTATGRRIYPHFQEKRDLFQGWADISVIKRCLVQYWYRSDLKMISSLCYFHTGLEWSWRDPLRLEPLRRATAFFHKY